MSSASETATQVNKYTFNLQQLASETEVNYYLSEENRN